ncbi:hypothetical protein ACTXT7_014231 [Hymenolepis weldensis]
MRRARRRRNARKPEATNPPKLPQPRTQYEHPQSQQNLPGNSNTMLLHFTLSTNQFQVSTTSNWLSMRSRHSWHPPNLYITLHQYAVQLQQRAENLKNVSSIDKVENIQSPTLVIHGTDDHVIGVHHGKELFARLPNPLDPLWVEGADHNNIELFHEYTIRLEKFFQVDMRHNMIHSGLDSYTTDSGRSQSSTRHLSALKTIHEHPPSQKVQTSHAAQDRHSWNSIQSSSSASSSTPANVTPEHLASTPLITSATKNENQAVDGDETNPFQTSLSTKSNEGTATALTGSSVSLPLDTSAVGDSGGKSLISSDHQNRDVSKTSELVVNQSPMEKFNQEIEEEGKMNHPSTTNENHDL